MKLERERKSTRLKGYDYSSPGIYFVTICTYQRACLFGKVMDGKMHLNIAGQIVEKTWKELPDHYLSINVAPFIIMPNHLHGLVEIKTSPRRGGFINPPLLMGYLKSYAVSKHGLPGK